MHVHVPVCAHVHVGYINFEAVVHSFVYISPVESANYEFCTLHTHIHMLKSIGKGAFANHQNYEFYVAYVHFACNVSE